MLSTLGPASSGVIPGCGENVAASGGACKHHAHSASGIPGMGYQSWFPLLVCDAELWPCHLPLSPQPRSHGREAGPGVEFILTPLGRGTGHWAAFKVLLTNTALLPKDAPEGDMGPLVLWLPGEQGACAVGAARGLGWGRCLRHRLRETETNLLTERCFKSSSV